MEIASLYRCYKLRFTDPPIASRTTLAPVGALPPALVHLSSVLWRRETHAGRGPRLRHADRRLPLGRARALQHRRGRLRSLGGRRSRARRDRRGWTRRAGSRAWTYARLREASNRLANALAARGVRRGDRVAILLPQSAAVAIAHVAVYKLGAVALPLAMLFGVDALGYRLGDAGATALITTGAGGRQRSPGSTCPISPACCAPTGRAAVRAGASRISTPRWRRRARTSRRSTPPPTTRR